jgi:hypothetical protein
MNSTDAARPMGNTPVTDAAAATAPEPSSPGVSSNADMRIDDNDHADERPFDRSDDAPESFNDGQDSDEAEQAQTLAESAIRGDSKQQFADSEDSERAAGDVSALGSEDVQDTVDHMHQMVSSGIIDNDAYRGERNDDDEPSTLGESGMEPGERDDLGAVRQADGY